jgi:hypothetical protein
MLLMLPLVQCSARSWCKGSMLCLVQGNTVQQLLC